MSVLGIQAEIRNYLELFLGSAFFGYGLGPLNAGLPRWGFA